MRFLWVILSLTVLYNCGGGGNSNSNINNKNLPQKNISKKGGSFGLEPHNFSDLKYWRQQNPTSAFTAFKKTCKQVPKRAHKTLIAKSPYFGDVRDWKALCIKQNDYSPAQAQQFFEQNFRPVKVNADAGKFTGYYEPILYGSMKRQGPYQHPIYALPKGLKKPYPSRGRITSGALSRNAKPLLWVNSEIDSFFLHIQGSGRVVMDNGEVVKLAYAGQNGHRYYAIGKYLIDAGHIPKEKMSARAIKIWLKDNPSQAQSVMNKNPSYVFFKLLKGNMNEYAKGAAGVPLTPEYSMAVDHKIYPYGLPMWVETKVTVPKNEKGLGQKMAFHRLMIAQDTGGAIKGAVRGDVFFGTGQHAEFMASHLSDAGEKYLLLPKQSVIK